MTKLIFIVTIVITVASVVTWRITGGDYYTKFEVVEEIEKPVDPDDPLAGTGFYENEMKKEVVTRKQFRFGLLPTPSGLFDKHVMSVVTVVSPFWGLLLLNLLWRRHKRRGGG